MSSNHSKAYCRLCAVKKKKNDLVKLDEDSSTAEKLRKVNVDLFIDFLPKTICKSCSSTLNKTVLFIDLVEKAQEKLSKELSGMALQTDDFDDFDDDLPLEALKSVEIKIEALDADKDSIKTVFPAETNSEYNSAGTSYDQYLSNELKIWMDITHGCSSCDLETKNVVELQQHVKAKHWKCNLFKCCTCNKSFQRYNIYVKHLKIHKPELRYFCPVCFKTMAGDLEIKKHMYYSHSEKFQCSSCNENFESAELLSEHINIFLPNKTTPKLLSPVQCEHCKKICPNKYKLSAHIKRMHCKRDKNIECPLCHKLFFDIYSLKDHKTIHADEKSFVCHVCGDSFKRHFALKSHVNVHYGVKPFECEVCTKKFRLRTQLESHKLTHSGLKPYRCTYCNKEFRFKSILNQHIRLHTGLKPYSCEECNRKFTAWPNYNKHMKRKHGVNCAKKKVSSNDIQDHLLDFGKAENIFDTSIIEQSVLENMQV